MIADNRFEHSPHGTPEQLRDALALRADVPVVLSSGFTEQEILNRFQGAGLDGVVQKPVRKASLLATIQAAIERKANS